MGKKGLLKENSKVMGCRRCGVCCTQHQAFVTPEDLERIITYLGITESDWDRLYDDPRWQFTGYRLIKHVSGGCAFLKYEKGLAVCEIHAVKPACCAIWQPDLERPECREGMRRRRS